MHEGNLCGEVPIEQSVCPREESRNITTVIELLQYHKHINTSESSVSTLKWWPFFLVSNADAQRIHVFYAFGTAELERSIGYVEMN